MIGEIIRCVRKIEVSEKPIAADRESELSFKVVYPFWNEIQRVADKKFDSTSIEDLCNSAKKAGIESEGQSKLDFSI